MNVTYDEEDNQVCLHIEDSDLYYATDDNGVDIFLTYQQVVDITMAVAAMKSEGLL